MDFMILRVILGSMGVFLIGQAGLLIWHLSRMNTTLVFIRLDVEKAMRDSEKRQESYNSQITALWKRVDDHSIRLNTIEQKCRIMHIKGHED